MRDSSLNVLELDGKSSGTKLLNKQLSGLVAKYHEYTRLCAHLSPVKSFKIIFWVSKL